ncbi:MAG: MFS transporter [Methylacidiphilaceae bacterium]|nr:MFS transporter [Candidatus Methylacidiphilaceae bacterium]
MTLFASFLYFDLSFAVWVLFGALGNFVAADFRLSPWQKGFLVAVPVLSGSLFRIALGWAETRFGGKRAALTGLCLTALPLLWGWKGASHLWELPAIGILLGVAGASFAVALPMASRWFPPEKQGLVLGLAGAGNSGTLFATLFGPYLASRLGWHAVFGLALLPILLTFLVVLVLAQDAPGTRATSNRLSQFRQVLRLSDTWVFALLYSVTFGGFIGFTSFLAFFFFDQYGVSKVSAGLLQTLVVAAGSFMRPVGGYLADRLGGWRLLCALLVGAAFCSLATSFFLPLPIEVGAFVVFLGSLGMGNGAVFQLVGIRLGPQIGLVTGLIGAAGGLGGFLLPLCLGLIKSTTESYATAFFLYASALAIAALISIRSQRRAKTLAMKTSASAVCLIGLASIPLWATGPLWGALPNPSLPEDDGVLGQETKTNRKSLSASIFYNEPDTSKRAPGSWFLSIGTGAGFPHYSSGDVVNRVTGAVEPLEANASFAVSSLLSIGYRWFNPERWGHWSFDADFVGAYLGTGVSGVQVRDHINLGFLGLRGRIGYRVLHDQFEPFLGFSAGAVIDNVETAGLDHGALWGYWVAPTGGIRLYIPQTRWSITVEGLFRFVGGLNGFDGGPGLAMNETPGGSHWIYVPLGVVAIGYRF